MKTQQQMDTRLPACHANTPHSHTTQAITGDTMTEPTLPDPITRNQRERRLAWLIFAAFVLGAVVLREFLS